MPPARLPMPPSSAQLFPYTSADDLAEIREHLRNLARSAGLDTDRAEALIVAVNELASNSIEHTHAGSGTLRVWRDDSSLVCQVEDHGHLEQTRVSADLPRTPGARGFGIPLVHQFTDQAEFVSGPEGTVWQLRMKLDGAANAGHQGVK